MVYNALNMYTDISTPSENLLAVLITILTVVMIWISWILYTYLRKRFPKEKSSIEVKEEQPLSEQVINYFNFYPGSHPPVNTLVLIEITKYVRIETPQEPPEDATIAYITCGLYHGLGKWSVLEMENPEESKDRLKYRWNTGLKETLNYCFQQIEKWKFFPNSKDNPEWDLWPTIQWEEDKT